MATFPENRTQFQNSEPKNNPIILALTLTPLVIITLVVIFGNALLITSVLRTRALRTHSNFYLVSMAFVDLTFGVVILPLNIANQINGGWSFDRVTCEFWATFTITCVGTSIFHICLIALDRYRSVTEGLSYIKSQSLKYLLLTIASAYVAALFVSVPPLLGFDPSWLKDFDTTNSCPLSFNMNYVLFASICLFLLPIVILIFLYYKIYRGIQERLRGRKSEISVIELQNSGTVVDSNYRISAHDGIPTNNFSQDEPDSTSLQAAPPEGVPPVLPRKTSLSQAVKNFLAKKKKLSIAKERNAAKTLAIIMGSFIACWLPFTIVYVTDPIISHSRVLIQAAAWFGYSNAAVNPIVYTVFSAEFRKAFKRILTCQRIKRIVAANTTLR